MGMSNRVPLIDLSVLPDSWIKDVTGWLGEVYLGTIAPGAAMRFVGDDLLVSVLRTSFPIVRWIDLWGQCWEHTEGEIYQIGVNAEWRP